LQKVLKIMGRLRPPDAQVPDSMQWGLRLPNAPLTSPRVAITLFGTIKNEEKPLNTF